MRLALALAAALALSACTESKPAAEAPAPTAARVPEKAPPTVGRPDANGVVKIEATRDSFVPSRIEAPAGKPVTLVFTRTEKKTCMSEAVFPDLGIRKELPLNEPVEVTVTPEAGKEIVFHCPMGMGRSTIVAVN
jgi:plastocyanin domain-containing protein